MTAGLPQLFAVLDTGSGFPTKNYIFHFDGNEITNIQLPDVYKEQGFEDTNQSSVEVFNHKYQNNLYSLQFWNTGLSIISSSYSIPIYEFNTGVFTDTSFPLYPVYIASTSNLLQSKRYQVIRKQRARLLHSQPILTITPTFTSTRMTVTPPSSSVFTLPRHAAQAIVRSLVEDKSTCCISTNSFDTIPVIGITPCFHCFDYASLETWLSGHSTCPECRASVTNSVRYEQKV